MRKISVSTVVFDGHPLETAFEELAALGLNYVEPAYIHGCMDFDETVFSDACADARRSQLSAAGLSAHAISAHINLAAPDAFERLARRLRFAAGIGAGVVITSAAARSDAEAVRGCLERALPLAEAMRVVIALENPGHGVDEIVCNGAAGAAFIANFGSDWLRLNYDIANVLTFSEGVSRPEDDIGFAAPAVAHCHVKDVRATPDGWVYVPLGDGVVGPDRIARLLAAAPDWICIELPLRLSRRRGGNPERLRPPLPLVEIRSALRTSIERLQSALRSVGEQA